ncbi:MFS transporter [Cytobacillus sp. IB215665]|uniref:MDR family MFS transporter n=1 Tax=Cytobacillus sp. IB215665 TaxID=3097357 RepID=UPI002A0FE952|nr:MFS transporter [Cytobacillus sp. IB215665]MDX8364589.1 MFS transporter [Cytobacillus sp. IB215665]
MKISTWNTSLKIRLIGEMLFNLLYWMYFPFITYYFGSALGNNIAGILMTIPPLIGIIGIIIGGNLADRLGRRAAMLIGTSIRTIVFCIFALSDSYWLSYLAFVGIGLGGALYGPASDAMIADLIPQQARKRVYATFMTANNIGAVIGPVLGSFFFFSYRSELLWACTIVMLVYTIIICVKVDESMPNYSRKRINLKSISSGFKEEWKGYGEIFRDKVFLLYILGGVSAVIAIMQLDLYLSVYIINYVPSQKLFVWNNYSVALDSKEIFAWMLVLNGVLFVFFVLPITKLLKNWTDRNVFILSAILAGGGMFLVGFTTNIWVLFILTIIFTFGEIVRAPVINNFVSNYAPEHARGKYMGAARLQFTIGRFLAPLTVFLAEWISPMGIFSVILFFAFMSAILYIKLYKSYERYTTGMTEPGVRKKM